MIKRELSNYECMRGMNLNLSDMKLASKIKIFTETCKKKLHELINYNFCNLIWD